MEYANFKMKCVDNKYNEDYYTVGRIYEVEDGFFLDDMGYETPAVNLQQIKDFKDWLHRTTAKWELVENVKRITGVALCGVCRRTFPLLALERYTSIKKSSISNTVAEYDAFDCPHCGCQYVTGVRLPRKFEEKERQENYE